MIGWPYNPNPSVNGGYVYPTRLSQADLADIRTVIAEELAKVEQGEYIEVEQVQNGKRYMGKLYLIDEDEED